MKVVIRRAAVISALALMTLASTASAQFGETGKLRLTGGVNTVDGVAGGGLTPWAVIGSNATADQVGAAPFGTVVKSRDYQLGTAGAAVGIRDRVELSFARQNFDTMATAAALGVPNLHLKQNIYGVKVKLFGNAILNQDTWLPQMAAGILYKDLDAGGLAPTLTALGADDHGADFYVSATKLHLASSVLVNGTLRVTKANQNGLLGFGGTAQGDYRPMAEGSVAYLFRKDLNNLKTQLTDQLCALSGGPCQYGGKDMKAAHEGMGVRNSHFNALVEVLQQSMDAKKIPFTVQNRMLALLAPMHRDIITK